MKVGEDFSKVLADMRLERTRSKKAAGRAVKIRAMVHDRVGSIDVNLLDHVLEVLGRIPPGVEVNKFSCFGSLSKKGNFRRNWNRRWFVFDPCERQLSYYTDSTLAQKKGSFMLSKVTSVRRITDPRDYPFAMYVPQN